MNSDLHIPENAKPIGYAWLAESFGIETIPHHVRSFLGTKSESHRIEKDGALAVVYPNRTKVGQDWLSHLEFAMKNEGIHLHLLRLLFVQVDPSLLVAALQNRPSGKYLRKIWYLYESLTGQSLLVNDLEQGNYVDLLDSSVYFTDFRYRVKRQRINMNLPGDLSFCGIVRRTSLLEKYCSADLAGKCKEIIDQYPTAMFERAMNYLYRKETKSSFEIENESVDQKRTGRFVNVLKDAGRGSFYSCESLTELQNLIVDPRFTNKTYRDRFDEQIYVGQSIGLGQEIVHFVGPKPQDTGVLMDQWADMATQLTSSGCEIHPVIAAAIVAYGFVFIHPFSDGNGRIHRFLIHHVLSKRGFALDDIIFPVSAVMLKRPGDYDDSLESFSKPLMDRVDYELDNMGRLEVLNETADFYRSIDYTKIAEILFGFVEETIQSELPEEFSFLENYDKTRRDMRSIVDLPDRNADLFIRLVLQNRGLLSRKKRKLSEFVDLTESEIGDLESVVSRNFSLVI